MNICPRCQQRYIASRTNKDFVHTCNSGNPTLDQEDLVLIATTVTEYGQTFTTKGKNSIFNQGRANAQWGTRASIEGERSSNTFTARGNNAKTTRQRQHKQYIDLSDKYEGD